MINYLHLSLDCFINYSIESLMINYRRLAEESFSDSQFILSQSWPAPLRFIREFFKSSPRWRARRTPAQPRWRSGLVGMALVFAPGLTSTFQPTDTDIDAPLREMGRQGMGSGLFKTSGTEHGTFHKTAKELHKQEEMMRRGGGVQRDEEPHAERVPKGYKKNMPSKTKHWYCVGCEVRMGSATKKNCSIRTCKRTCCTDCLAIDPGAQSVRRICPHCVTVNNCLGSAFIRQ